MPDTLACFVMTSHPSKKRRRELSSSDALMFEIYEDLANENEGTRLKAASRLVSRYSPERSPSAADLQKVLQRLIRGLSSSRKAARFGFSIALTELLAQHLNRQSNKATDDDGQRGDALDRGITLDKVIDILEQTTQVNSQMSGQEERDHHWGKVFGAEAIIKSGAPFGVTDDHEKDSPWRRLLGFIFQAANEKMWLREHCGWVCCEAVKLVPPNGFMFADAIIQALEQHGLGKTAESVAAWLTIHKCFPEKQLEGSGWGPAGPLHNRHRRVLVQVLAESSPSDDQSAQAKLQKGSRSSKPHFAWNVVIDALLLAHNVVQFRKDWSTLVDGMRRKLHPFNSIATDIAKMAYLQLHPQTSGSIGASHFSKSTC